MPSKPILRAVASGTKGKVTRVHYDDTFDIEFDDGDSEKRVELKRIKVLGGGSRSRSRSPDGVRELREGQKQGAK